MLVMDAENAFNSINRTALLWNIRILWPRASRFVFNTYRGWSPLIIKGHDVGLYSSEGVIQENPLSMFLYALATLPLINQLQSDPSITQLWYADDSSAVGCFSSLLLWYENLCLIGPLFGYTPAPTKSHLVVKESMIDTASSLFANTGINIVTRVKYSFSDCIYVRTLVCKNYNSIRHVMDIKLKLRSSLLLLKSFSYEHQYT